MNRPTQSLIGDLQAAIANAERVNSSAERALASMVSPRKYRMNSPVSLQRATANRKLAPQRAVMTSTDRRRLEPVGPYCASTYVSIAATCPASCPFKSGGCFAAASSGHLTMRRLDAAAVGMSALEVTQVEAETIDRAWLRGVPQDGARGGRDLRLHVGGEVSDVLGAELLAGAAERYQARGGGAVWSFTHQWEHGVDREAWGPVSVLASVQDVRAAEGAAALGYAPAIVLPVFPSAKAFRLRGSDRRWIPCPAETRKTTCVDCRLCLDDDRLREHRLGIAFAVHGRDADKARARLPTLQHEHGKENG